VLQEDLADQLAAAPDAGLGEDRLEVVLDGVRRQAKDMRHLPGGDALHAQPRHLGLPLEQPVGERHQRATLADFWTNPARTEPLQAALMAGEFAAHIRTGDVYSVEEVRSRLDHATADGSLGTMIHIAR
jgi:hypothetical protein